MPCERETELAELIRDAMPTVEMVRMVSSGTEAAMNRASACAASRAGIGSSNSPGAITGTWMRLLVSAGSSALTLGVPTSPGVPRGCTADTLVLRYNDVAGLREVFKRKATKSRR